MASIAATFLAANLDVMNLRHGFRPAVPEEFRDDLLLRMGWPIRRQAGCWDTLRQMAHVRRRILLL